MSQLFARIPRERIGVLIGANGNVKEYIERKLPVKLDINSETGDVIITLKEGCLLYTSPSPRDGLLSRMPSSA